MTILTFTARKRPTRRRPPRKSRSARSLVCPQESRELTRPPLPFFRALQTVQQNDAPNASAHPPSHDEPNPSTLGGKRAREEDNDQQGYDGSSTMATNTPPPSSIGTYDGGQSGGFQNGQGGMHGGMNPAFNNNMMGMDAGGFGGMGEQDALYIGDLQWVRTTSTGLFWTWA